MRSFCTLMAYASAALVSVAALAQGSADAYPSRPVTVIVPFSPGGSTDREARLYSTKMSGLTGQSFAIDYKPGGASTIGTAYVAKAAPDGYTLLAVAASFTVFPALYKDLSFDTIRDFAPVSLMSKRVNVLVAHPSLPASNFREYIAYATANPAKINFGTSGLGDVGHLGGAWMHNATNTRVTFVHYKGTGPLLPDLLSGRVDVTAAGLVAMMPQIKSGKVRGLAILDDQRSNLLPNMLTVSEQGIPGYNYAGWLGFSAPGSTPAAIVTKLNADLARIAKMPDVIASLEADGGMLVASTPGQFRELIVTETARWRKVVQDAGIKLEE